jgi:hypothetical protein
MNVCIDDTDVNYPCDISSDTVSDTKPTSGDDMNIGNSCDAVIDTELKSGNGFTISNPCGTISDTQPKSSSSVSLSLTEEKLRSLLGYKGENKNLLRFMFGVNISINFTNETAEISTKSKTDNFDNIVWAKELYRYLRSACRNGFVKKLPSGEFNHLTDIQLANMNNIFEKIKNQFAVEVVWHDCNGIVYICVLEMIGVTPKGGLEAAIATAGNVIHLRYSDYVALGAREKERKISDRKNKKGKQKNHRSIK